jgi:hypothetical protein
MQPYSFGMSDESNTKTITFCLDTHDVLTVNKAGEIYVRAMNTDDDYAPCVAIITRAQWDGLQDDFFTRKLDYNERWKGDWCGVESINAEATNLGKQVELYCESPIDDPGEMKVVEMFRVETVELEMEHG